MTSAISLPFHHELKKTWFATQKDAKTSYQDWATHRRRHTGRETAQAQEDEQRHRQQKSALESKRMERHLRMENEIVETLDNNVWDARYDTNSPTFLLPSQRYVKK